MKEIGKGRLAVIIVSALVLAFVCVSLLTEAIQNRQADAVQEKALSMYAGAPRPNIARTGIGAGILFDADAQSAGITAEEAEITAQEPQYSFELPEVQEDFLELYEANPDIVGWLKAGERIDYPVVQRDNNYYLKHDFYGKRASNGTLFVNAVNCMYPRDDVILIHGHNMKSGAMFGTLKKYQEFEYLAEYPIVTFRTIYDAEDVYYTPIAAFNASMDRDNKQYFNIMRYLFEDDPVDPTKPVKEPKLGEPVRKSREYSEYLDALRKWSIWKPKTDVNTDDSLLMLVTCSYYQDNGRLMLVCRALRDGETPESIAELYAPYVKEKPAA